MNNGVELRGFLPAELEQLLAGWGEAPYRGRQLFQWLHKYRVHDYESMTNLPRSLRLSLAEQAALGPVKIARRQVATDGLTIKLLLRLVDGETVECVLMSYLKGRRRQTACLSSQVGCAMGCSFCATGQGGLRRNLTTGEIILQALALGGELEVGNGEDRLSNVVFMGMGEPLLNYEAVLKAVRVFENPLGWGISRRRITVSTCGLVPQIKQLALEQPPLELAVSLHATTNKLRDQLMPVNRRYPLEELLPVCRYYAETTGRRVTFEYALIAGVNDNERDARRLAELTRGMLAFINVIPLNPVKATRLSRVPANKTRLFARWLQESGLEVAVRESRGQDIAAACGQLRSNIGQEVF